MELTDAQIERYSRQIILPAIGGRGQQRLLDSMIRVIGEGPLAATAALYLTAAGIGCLELLTITVEGRNGMEAARQDLAAFNADTMVRVCPLDRAEALAPSASRAAAFVCAEVPVAVLARVNHAALHQGVPVVAGAAGEHARIAFYAGHRAGCPCAECDPQPPVCESGETVADATVGVIGSLLALDAVTSFLGLPASRPGRALHYDPQTLTITECRISKRASCRACGSAATTDT